MFKSQVIELYKTYNNDIETHLANLENIIKSSNGTLEGNSFYHHLSLDRYDDLLNKQVNLFYQGIKSEKRICEIGFNAGHSTMLILLGKNRDLCINYTIFDIVEHPYVRNCFEYIKMMFPNVRFEFVEGDSRLTFKNWLLENNNLIGEYDLIHVDGGHITECITNDILNSDHLLCKDGIMIVDDTNKSHINYCVDLFVRGGRYYDIDILKPLGYEHRIIKKYR